MSGSFGTTRPHRGREICVDWITFHSTHAATPDNTRDAAYQTGAGGMRALNTGYNPAQAELSPFTGHTIRKGLSRAVLRRGITGGRKPA